MQRVTTFTHAVDGVSFKIRRGGTMGLVGESGCGKTTVGKLILRLIKPSSGKIIFDGIDITELKKRAMRQLRRHIQTVFQDPQSSLNPRMTIKEIIGEPLLIHNIAKGPELRERVQQLLEEVGLKPWHLNRLPHEFSGGQRQRICISRALASNPKFLVLDEPTSSLDVSVQSQILNLLKDLQRKLSLTFLFISHNLEVIEYLSNTVAVMYVGKIVETADKKSLFGNPMHPYTKALLSAIPVPDPDYNRKRIILKGEVPSSINPPAGCRFHPRCICAMPVCREKEPNFAEQGNGHYVACHLFTKE